MTIAVGVLATDGVVLAADTQLTIPSFWKGEGGKIMASARGSRDKQRVAGACAITGATNVYEYLHALGDELTKDFENSLQDADKPAAYKRFSSVVRRFHRRHVLPLSQAHNPPEVNVLIAYQRGDQFALWQSAHNAVIEQYDHGAVGIGNFAATAWLNRTWKIGLDVPTAIVVATFAAAVAKESVDGCGKFTNVLVVQGNSFRRIDQRVINHVDRLYETFSSEIQPAILIDCFGETPYGQPSLTADGLKKELGDVITALREDTPDYVKQWRTARLERLVGERVHQVTTNVETVRPPSQE